MTEKNLHKITLNITGEQQIVLDGIRRATGRTVTDQLRQSIDLYHHILKALKRGATVEVIEENGKSREITILF